MKKLLVFVFMLIDIIMLIICLNLNSDYNKKNEILSSMLINSDYNDTLYSIELEKINILNDINNEIGVNLEGVDTFDEIKIKLPVSYEELDYESNIYQERYYGINYDKKNDVYQYNVNYSLTGNTITPDRVISNIWISTQGAYQPLVYEKTVTYNEKEYDVYFGGYTNKGAGFGQPTSTTSHYVNKKVLIHKLKTGGCLVIEVDGNNIEISEQLLNDLTNIDIMNKEYK